LEGVGPDLIEILSRHLLEGIEENHRKVYRGYGTVKAIKLLKFDKRANSVIFLAFPHGERSRRI
jgi:hypothetical protein